MKAAIMQPYMFPYIGYFQLIKSVDVFVFYDDVNFIKRGWINRNQILVNGNEFLFSIPLVKASQNKLINEVEVKLDEKWLLQFYSTLEQNYINAPYFKETVQLIKKVFSSEYITISDLAVESVKKVTDYLGFKTNFEKSSISYEKTKGRDKADRLIDICKLRNADTYINPAGGKELYSKEYFKKQDVDLFFIENKITPYQQFENKFVGGLSIIDVLMFNSIEQIQDMLNDYSLV